MLPDILTNKLDNFFCPLLNRMFTDKLWSNTFLLGGQSAPIAPSFQTVQLQITNLVPFPHQSIKFPELRQPFPTYSKGNCVCSRCQLVSLNIRNILPGPSMSNSKAGTELELPVYTPGCLHLGDLLLLKLTYSFW